VGDAGDRNLMTTLDTRIKQSIRDIPDFPKPGIIFKDITPVVADPPLFRDVIAAFADRYQGKGLTTIIGIESRGFILGSILAYHFHKGFVPVRKKGKLPGEVISQTYDLEYGTDTLELHVDSIKKNQKVLVIDDLLATGGTAFGAIKLIEKLEGKVVEFAVIVDLPDLNGKKKLEAAGHKVFTLVEYEGL